MSYSSLISKLDAFIRKYYRNKALRGTLIATTILTAGFLILAGAEYFGRFGVLGRTILFWSFASAVIGVLGLMVVWPIMQLMRLGGIINHEEASKIVGNHFPKIKDKLLNTLQLQKQIDGNHGDVGLLLASVEQRTAELSPVSFTGAVDLRENVKYLKYAIGPVLVLVAVLLWKPQVVSEPAGRLIQHRTSFKAPAPFRFELVSTPLKTPVGETFNFIVRVVGNTVPATVYLVESGNKYRMERLQGDLFQYVFSALRSDAEFLCTANGWDSPTYYLRALPVPKVVDFSVEATPPSYTGLDVLHQENHGDILVPEGTIVKWECKVSNANKLGIRVGDSLVTPENVTGHIFIASWKASSTLPYWLVPENDELGAVDSIRYALRVVADRRPIIRVIEVEDSTVRKLRYFTGSISDDYGFSRLAFAVKKVGTNHTEYSNLQRPSGKSDDFYYTWDMQSLDLRAGDAVEYWVEVWDNDGVNGAKSARTSTRVFSAPDNSELLAERDESNAEIEASIEDAVEKANELRKEMDAFKERLREEREMDWQDKRALEELLKKQEELRKNIDDVKKANERKNDRLNEFSPQEERIMEKQEELQKLMEDVMSDELREIYQKMQELMDEMNPNDIQKQLEKMDVGQDALEKELDRALEQFKQLEWEVKMEESINELKKLAEDQKKLAEKTEKEEKPNDELKASQDSINKAFNDIKKKLDELKKENEELENPNSMLDSDNEEKEIEESLEKSSEELEKGKEKKASEKQKDAAEQMEDLAQRMETMQMKSEEEDEAEDMDALRALLENIIELSFDEELLIRELKKTDTQDPRYVIHGQTQRSLKDEAKMVEDSLFALSLRVRQLAGAVNREIGLVNHHMSKALAGFGDRITAEITMNQQYVMTSFNNLALLLDEALKSMQQKQEQKQPGSGNCNKPGGSGQKPSAKASDMKKMQKALGKKLEAMKKSMGKNANKGESGKKGKGMSKELAEMAAQQAALREMAKKRAQELNEDGSGEGNEMKKIAEEMEDLERDLVNRKVDIETLERQQEILSRLLDAENADRIRGEKDERKSRVGDLNLHPDSPQMIDYLKEKANELELLRTVPVDLVPYYRDRVNDYFNNLGTNPQDINP